MRVFRATEIARFRAEHKYTVFELDGTEHLLEESLSDLEAKLLPWGFLRVHRGELLQLSRIRALHPRGKAAVAELEDGQRAPVSRRRLAALRMRLQEL